MNLQFAPKIMYYQLFLSGVVAVGSILLINKLLIWYSISKKIKKKQKDVNGRKSGLIHKFQGMNIPFENKEICHLTGSEIHAKIKSGEFSAVDILEAFQANALVENQQFNFLADIIYEADVSSLMADLNNDSKITGFPLGVSDSICVGKYDSTLGLLRETFHPSKKDSTIIRVLRECGAIPAIITSVGQAGLSTTTSNPIVGKTINPLDIKRMCGGSSGGLAVAIATRSCLIGVANDIQGSIRIPASFCGVFGLKTSFNRISQRRMKSVWPQQSIIKDSIGAMARNVDDLVSLFRSMVSLPMYQLDPLCAPVPFNEALFSRETPLNIGYYVGIGGRHSHPVPAVERAVLLAKKVLEQAGHKLVEYQLPNMEFIDNKIFTKIMFSDGGQGIMKVFKNEPIDSSLRSCLRVLSMPRVVKRLLGFVSGWFCKSGASYLTGMAGTSSVLEVWQLQQMVEQYREEVLVSWENQMLDALICPVLPIVAPPVKSSNCILNDNPYVVVYNVLDYVAGAVPVTQVTQEDIDLLDKTYSKKSQCCHKIVQSQKGSIGLPVGVQCVALPWREEVALRVMKNLADNL